MKNIKFNSFHYFILLFLFLFNHLFSQNYTVKYVNKAPLYATASILQDYDSDGDLDIIITRRKTTTDIEPSSVEWLENDGSGQFPRNTLFGELSVPIDIDLGDFNKDGLFDYVVSQKYLNLSTGALILAIKQNDGNYNVSIIEDSIRTDQSAVADFDNDGNLDIVSVGFNRNDVSIYWNDGSLNFSKQPIADSVIQVQLVEIDDIDDDGDTDILYGGGGLNGFRLLYNNGAGIFDSSKTLFLNNGQYSNAKRGMTIADVNNDGIKDIVAFSGVGFGGMYFLDGSQNFESSIIDIDGIDLGGDIIIYDFDQNGLNDIIRQNGGDNYLSILYQDTELNFRVELLEQNWDNQGPGQMSIGDLDGDGDIDLVFPENGNVDGDLSWFENINGKLYRHNLYSEIEAVRVPKLGDIDNDGDIDIVITAGDDGAKSEEDEINWFENRGSENFIEHRVDDNITAPGDVELGDIDSDGFLDIVATSYEDSTLIWYKKDGEGWIKNSISDNLVNPLGCEISDIDSDNDLDIIVCSSGEDKIILFSNNGSGIFTRSELNNSIIMPQEIKALDLNNDNEIDFVVCTLDTNNTIVAFLNDGLENFSKTILAVGQQSTTLGVGYWDNNDTPDIIAGFDKGTVLGEEQRDIAVFLNDGLANFIDSSLVMLEERTSTLELVDLDNDSDVDIIFGSGSSGILPLRIAINSDGKIEMVKEISKSAARVYGIAGGDLTGDGTADIIASDQVNSTNNLLLLVGDISTDVNENITQILPNKMELLQNYPNPFNPETTIKFTIDKQKDVSLIVYNLLGERVKTLLNGEKQKGVYEITWNGKNENGTQLPSGIYFLRFEADGTQFLKKLVMLK